MISRLVVALSLLSSCALACSSGDGTDLDARAPDSTSTSSQADSSGGGSDGAPAGGSADSLPDGSSASTEFALTVPPSVIDVPETGIPGLDSEDEFCASWSRFGGSFQVIAVNAAFGEGSPDSVAVLEVLASPTVADAYDDLDEIWPTELAEERSAALDDALGPFARRLRSARESLDSAGATSDDLDAIEAAWLGALASRVPDSADVVVDLPDEIWAKVDAAAATHLERAGGWFDDTSLVTRVEMPRTDGYLATRCPDQGTLAGGDADG